VYGVPQNLDSKTEYILFLVFESVGQPSTINLNVLPLVPAQKVSAHDATGF
jgi:hypothetical protein